MLDMKHSSVITSYVHMLKRWEFAVGFAYMINAHVFISLSISVGRFVNVGVGM